jgi:hypothetical protein
MTGTNQPLMNDILAANPDIGLGVSVKASDLPGSV